MRSSLAAAIATKRKDRFPALSPAVRRWNAFREPATRILGVVVILSGFAWMGGAEEPWTIPARFLAGAFAAGVAWAVVGGGLHIVLGEDAFKDHPILMVVGGCGIVVAAHTVLGAHEYPALFEPDALALGFRAGMYLGYPWFMATGIRDELRDRRGRAWPAFASSKLSPYSLTKLLLLSDEKLNRDQAALLERTQPRKLRRREHEAVDISDLKLNPGVARRWTLPARPCDLPTTRRTTRRILWALALNLGIAENKKSVVRYCDEVSALQVLVRELSDEEWDWVRRAWIALDHTSDEGLIASMEGWEWIEQLPHSPRTLEEWQSFWAENLRVGREKFHAKLVAEGDPNALELDRLKAELAAMEAAEKAPPETPAPRVKAPATPKLLPAPPRTQRKGPTEEERALEERERGMYTLHQGPVADVRPRRRRGKHRMAS